MIILNFDNVQEGIHKLFSPAGLSVFDGLLEHPQTWFSSSYATLYWNDL